MEMGKILSAKPPLAYGAIKKALRAGLEVPFSDARSMETRLFGKLCISEDKTEGVKAFLENSNYLIDLQRQALFFP
jgi:enoyl-CoA hydratase